MKVFGKKGLGGNAAVAAVSPSYDSARLDGRSDTWEQLVASGDGRDGTYAHQSRHAKRVDVGEVVGDLADVVVATAIVDTALNIQVSNANYRDALGVEDTEGAHDLAAGFGAGIVGTLFGA